MMATQLLVVPRSIPMILPMLLSFRFLGLLDYTLDGVFAVPLQAGIGALHSLPFATATSAGRSTRSLSA